jgi:hypothetical protein
MQRMTAARAALIAARTLGAMGYACFPCRQDKRPATTNGFKDAVTERDAIEALWRRYPGVLVGVATGEMSGIAVVDVDTTKHDAAREWWIKNRAWLLPARVHCTQSGGRHVIYRHRAGLTCSASKIARGVDVRADGGYIIWWPAAGYPVLEDSGIQPWPEWLVPLLQPAPVPAPAATSRRALAVRDGDLRPVLHRAGGVLRTLVNAGEGERNRILFWAACRVRDMYATNELDHVASMQMIALLREGAARIGLGQREAERTIASAFQRGAAA